MKTPDWDRFRRGDDAALERLYRTCYPVLFRYGRSLVHDDELVRDCLHDVFVGPHRYRATLNPNPDPNMVSTAYAVRVRQVSTSGSPGVWQNVAEYKKKVNSGSGPNTADQTQDATLVYFDNNFATGSVDVEVTVNYTTATLNSSTVRVRPGNIVPSSIDNAARKVVFRIAPSTPSKRVSLEVKINNVWDLYRNLHVFCSDPLSAPPTGATVFGPSVHELTNGVYEPANGETIHIAAGAAVNGSIHVTNRTGVKIQGRGIIYVPGDGENFYKRAINVRSSTNTTISGITILKDAGNPGIFAAGSNGLLISSVKIMSSGKSGDGIHTLVCQNMTIEYWFIRTSDDCISIYASRPDAEGGLYAGDSRNHLIQHTQLWANVVHPMFMGTHGSQDPANRDIIESVTYRNIDVLEHEESQTEFQGVMAVNSGDETSSGTSPTKASGSMTSRGDSSSTCALSKTRTTPDPVTASPTFVSRTSRTRARARPNRGFPDTTIPVSRPPAP